MSILPDGENIGFDAPFPGARTLHVGVYEWPKWFYAKGIAVDAPGIPYEARRTTHSAAFHLRELGCLLRAELDGKMGLRSSRTKRIIMNIDDMVKKWHRAVVGLAVAHDKDEADRYEASIEECLSPLLTAPIRQIREFAPKLLASLKADASVPFLVWRAYEVWLEDIFNKAPDEGVIQLKTALATEICILVESDVKEQLPEAIIRALQWRSAKTLENFKETIVSEKAKGNKVRLRGRESCTFLECGGTEESPAICVQL